MSNLLAKFEFWYARNFIKLDKHYTFFLDLSGDPGSFAIKYLKKYDGVIVEFNHVKLDDNGELSFDYDIISNVNNCNVKSKSFERFTLNVMRSIIYGAIKNLEKDFNENGKLDLVKSDSERGIHEEVTPVLEEGVSDRKPRKKTVRRDKGVHPKV